MRQKTRLRKEKEDASVAELRVQLQRMERALAQEVRRRVDAVERQKQNAAKLEEKFDKILEERSQMVDNRIDALEERVSRLEERLAHESQTVPAQIEARGDSLEIMLKDVRNELETEKRNRLHREGRLLTQLEEHSRLSEEYWQKERTSREEAMESLQREWQAQEEQRNDAQQALEEELKAELEALRLAVDREVEDRSREDDQIFESIHRPVTK
eukprot:CAMPEP_0118673394 /NCGR_PEP_ID=MMETSP0800-20121206/295_1 /TAXON_ID=210618 ORGANISM="Striatella unipunctata, Strain CCMP2910" /NCGR_SAMPLE_ID=MMETSP0800 /ASSEMBLY_ACC=CAM_ASM_000638 /LENGTH=213 /DNA_ID=CAMNT_0006568447 /DNA_START=6 /DNA_END=648 /DNA_ORIENTATION=-